MPPPARVPVPVPGDALPDAPDVPLVAAVSEPLSSLPPPFTAFFRARHRVIAGSGGTIVFIEGG